MNKPMRTIEVEEKTAAALEARAAERGQTVDEVVADLMSLDDLSASGAEDELVELDRRWARIEAGEQTVSHDDAARWLKTWGTAEFKPWKER